MFVYFVWQFCYFGNIVCVVRNWAVSINCQLNICIGKYIYCCNCDIVQACERVRVDDGYGQDQDRNSGRLYVYVKASDNVGSSIGQGLIYDVFYWFSVGIGVVFGNYIDEQAVSQIEDYGLEYIYRGVCGVFESLFCRQYKVNDGKSSCQYNVSREEFVMVQSFLRVIVFFYFYKESIQDGSYDVYICEYQWQQYGVQAVELVSIFEIG